MGKRLSTHESELGKGYAEVHFDFKEELINNKKQILES